MGICHWAGRRLPCTLARGLPALLPLAHGKVQGRELQGGRRRVRAQGGLHGGEPARGLIQRCMAAAAVAGGVSRLMWQLLYAPSEMAWWPLTRTQWLGSRLPQQHHKPPPQRNTLHARCTRNTLHARCTLSRVPTSWHLGAQLGAPASHARLHPLPRPSVAACEHTHPTHAPTQLN